MAIARLNEARWRLIRERQWKDRWGGDYIASIFATPKEAPGVSVPMILKPEKLEGREFHTLSQPETWASLLALHHPRLWEVHEQRILYPTPRAHYLFGHPRAVGQNFPSFAGTLDVADRLGMLSKHPKVRIKHGNDPAQWPMAPFPYIGDLLLFLEDKKGPYAVNLPVKDKYRNFRRRGPHPQGKPRKDVDDEGAIARQLLEKTYYADAGIRTQPVAGEEIDFDLRCNLADLFGDHALPLNIEDEVRGKIIALYRSAIGADVPAYVVATEAAARFNMTVRDAIALMRQGIWRRELRIDLFRPFLTDRPLRPEVEDVFERYGHWFAR